MIFFTADTHFGHTNIIRHTHRPFSNTHEMDSAIIKNWNEVVCQDDTVYHLGDVGWNQFDHCVYQLNGKIVLIRGNHDKHKDEHLYSEVHDTLLVNYKKTFLWLSHYSHRVWPHQRHKCIHLYGHSHGSLPGTKYSFDVGVDCWDMRPLSFDQVVEIIQGGNHD